MNKKSGIKIKINNFGPIENAEIDLRPLTVFVGPSNTGKSYAAILIYALQQHFHNIKLKKSKIDKEVDIVVSEIIEQLSKNKTHITIANFPNIFTGNYIVTVLSHCFGVSDTKSLIRIGSKQKKASIGINSKLSGNSEHYKFSLDIKEKSTKFKPPALKEIKIPVNKELRNSIIHNTYDQRHTTVTFIMEEIIKYCWRELALPAFYLPAGRTGIMHANKVVLKTLLESASMSSISSTKEIPSLSKVNADFLQSLLDLDYYMIYNEDSSKEDFGEYIEQNILLGEIKCRLSELTNHPNFTYKPKGWKSDLPLMNSSSMVSELAPIVLYLRYMVRPNNVLIIEEPEAHLHPAMQTKFVQHLAYLINCGTRIIITTHSEWILEALANVVQRSKVPEASKEQDSVSLLEEQVGVWLFKQNNKSEGSTVDKIEIDDEYGLYDSGFEEVARELHNDSARIDRKIRSN